MKVEIFTTEKVEDAEIVYKYTEKCYLLHDLDKMPDYLNMKEKALKFINSDYPHKAKNVLYRHFEELPKDGFIEVNIYFTNSDAKKDEYVYDGYHEKEVKYIDGKWLP